MPEFIQDKHGNPKLIIQAPVPEKHVLLSDSLERALVRGELDDLSFKQVCQRYLSGRTTAYAGTAVRYVLRWLVSYGYSLPAHLQAQVREYNS